MINPEEIKALLLDADTALQIVHNFSFQIVHNFLLNHVQIS